MTTVACDTTDGNVSASACRNVARDATPAILALSLARTTSGSWRSIPTAEAPARAAATTKRPSPEPMSTSTSRRSRPSIPMTPSTTSMRLGS